MQNVKCIYHRVMKRENFEKAANDIYDLLVEAQKKYPDSPRVLYLDIDSHRNSENGFDKDMMELQKDFYCNFLKKLICHWGNLKTVIHKIITYQKG